MTVNGSLGCGRCAALGAGTILGRGTGVGRANAAGASAHWPQAGCRRRLGPSLGPRRGQCPARISRNIGLRKPPACTVARRGGMWVTGTVPAPGPPGLTNTHSQIMFSAAQRCTVLMFRCDASTSRQFTLTTGRPSRTACSAFGAVLANRSATEGCSLRVSIRPS